MVRAGDVVWNPLTGEKALVLESAEETAGARIVLEFAVEEGGFVPGGEHVHDNSSEHFDVLGGRITFVVDGEERTLEAGEQVTVERGQWHRWWNAGEGEVRSHLRMEPPLRFHELILIGWGLCADGHTNEKGTPLPAPRGAGSTATAMSSASDRHPNSCNESCSRRWRGSLG